MALVALQGRAEVKAENSTTFDPCAALPVHSRCPSPCSVPAGQPCSSHEAQPAAEGLIPHPAPAFHHGPLADQSTRGFPGAAGAPSEGIVLLSAAPGPGDGLVPTLSRPPPCHSPCLGTGWWQWGDSHSVELGGDSARPLWESMESSAVITGDQGKYCD